MENEKASHHAGYLLKVVQQEIRNLMDKELKMLNLTTPQYASLSVINEFPGISNAEVARKCFVTAQTMILIINKLEKRELIRRAESRTHGRIQQIELSAKGTELLQRAHSIVFGIEERIFCDLTNAEIERLCDLLKKVKTSGN